MKLLLLLSIASTTTAFSISSSTLCKVRSKNGLNIQSGLGDSTAILCRQYPHMRIMGIEKDPELCRLAKERYPHLLFLQGNVLDMHFFPDSFDLIQVPLLPISSEPLLLKLHTMLHPKGLLRIVDEEGDILYRIRKQDLRR